MAFDIGAPTVHELALALSSPHTRMYLVPRAAGAVSGPGGMGVCSAAGACEGPVRARGRRERGVVRGRRRITCVGRVWCARCAVVRMWVAVRHGREGRERV